MSGPRIAAVQQGGTTGADNASRPYRGREASLFFSDLPEGVVIVEGSISGGAEDGIGDIMIFQILRRNPHAFSARTFPYQPRPA